MMKAVCHHLLARKAMQETKKSLFGGSLKSMLCFFVKEENLTIEEIKELLDIIAQEEEL